MEAALTAARDLFWRAGYDETSIEDVVEATGFNRYALYKEFGGKREVFLAALEAYHQEGKAIFLSSLGNSHRSPVDAVREVLGFAVEEMARRGAGCLLCNVARELARRDPVVRARVEAYMDEMVSAFQEAFSRAAAREELNPNVAPESAARLVMVLIKGLGAAAEMGATRRELMEIIEVAFSALSPPQPSGRRRSRDRREEAPCAHRRSRGTAGPGRGRN
ncbi:MAG: TetR/AcrR family transcriptional regulator [Pseudomonadota bacterium]